MKKRLFHIDYFGIMRDIVRIFIEHDSEILLAQSQPGFDDVMQQLHELDIDILILGNSDPAGEILNYPDLCSRIRVKFPTIRIIVHSISASRGNISEAMNAGADGFVTNDMGFEDILAALTAIKNDSRYLSKKNSSSFQNAFEFLAGLTDKLEQNKSIFTSRELEILNHIARGHTNKQIAAMLHISPKTVETHRKHLVEKAKVKNTAELIAYSSTYGLCRINLLAEEKKL